MSADAFAGACTVMNGEVRHHHIDIESAEDDEDIGDDALEDALDSALEEAESVLKDGGGKALQYEAAHSSS